MFSDITIILEMLITIWLCELNLGDCPCGKDILGIALSNVWKFVYINWESILICKKNKKYFFLINNLWFLNVKIFFKVPSNIPKGSNLCYQIHNNIKSIKENILKYVQPVNFVVCIATYVGIYLKVEDEWINIYKIGFSFLLISFITQTYLIQNLK